MSGNDLWSIARKLPNFLRLGGLDRIWKRFLLPGAWSILRGINRTVVSSVNVLSDVTNIFYSKVKQPMS